MSFVQLVKTLSQGDYIDLRGQVSTGTGTTNYKFNDGACQMTVMELFGYNNNFTSNNTF